MNEQNKNIFLEEQAKNQPTQETNTPELLEEKTVSPTSSTTEEDILNDKTSLLSLNLSSENDINDNNIEHKPTPTTKSEEQTPPPEEPTNDIPTDIPSTPNTETTPTNNNSPQDNNLVSIKKYLGYIILFRIPTVGIIALIIKALDKKNKNISNLAKAELIFILIKIIIITIIMIIIFIGIFSISGIEYIDDHNPHSKINDYYNNSTSTIDSNYETIIG